MESSAKTIYLWALIAVSVVLADLKIFNGLWNLVHDKIFYISSEFSRGDIIFIYNFLFILVIIQVFQVQIKLNLIILIIFYFFYFFILLFFYFVLLLQAVIRPIFKQGVWKLSDGWFEYDNRLSLISGFIELRHVTGFIKCLYLIKMFIFINAKKVHSFSL